MMDLRELYQEVIIDHNNNPRNFHDMPNATATAEGFNRLCGDRLKLFLKLENNKIVHASFLGSGCAISTASASLMTEVLQGKSLSEAHELFSYFHRALTKEDPIAIEHLGKLTVLLGVKAFPARVKCATLAWHTLEAAMDKKSEVVTTEG